MYCILVNRSEVIGPFASAQEAARWQSVELEKPISQNAVIMRMTNPEPDNEPRRKE